MSRTATGAGAQKAYSAKGLSNEARERYKHQRKKDYQADLDGRSYDDATIAGGITMPLRSDAPVGTNNHDGNNNSVLRVDPSANFPCFITPRDGGFDSDQKKIANDMLPIMNITGYQNISNVQAGLQVSMETYGPFSLTNLRVKTCDAKVEEAEAVGGDDEKTADKFKSGDVKRVEGS